MNKIDAAALGRAIRLYRVARDMSQLDLAAKTGLTSGYLSKLERGHDVPTLETLADVADALGTTPGRLLTFAETGEGFMVVRDDR